MRCKCGKAAVFFRKYEGTHLCKNHFLQSIERKVKKTIGKYRMIRSGDRIVCAISGGKDSSLALYMMHKIAGPRKDIEILAVTVDEGIRGYRPGSIRIAKKLCKELGIEHHIVSFKDVFGKTLDQKVREILKTRKALEIKEPCTYCGVGRRYILNKTARDLGATKLCMGHNLDDETQAVIMNYIRGDIYRAARMGPVTSWSLGKEKGKMFIPRIKPLRFIPERESALYVMLKNIPVHWAECPYASGIRFKARDFINDLENDYPGIKFTILQTFDRMLPAIRKISKREESKIKICKFCGEPGSKSVCKTCQLWRS